MGAKKSTSEQTAPPAAPRAGTSKNRDGMEGKRDLLRERQEKCVQDCNGEKARKTGGSQ